MHIPTFEIFIGICAVFLQQTYNKKRNEARDTIIDEYDLSNLEERLIEAQKQVQGKMAAEKWTLFDGLGGAIPIKGTDINDPKSQRGSNQRDSKTH